MQWLNYHHLYYFFVIATEQSVTKASKKLRLAQSTLSAQLTQFEENVGVKMFDRKNKQLILTDMGRRVYEYANQIFSLGTELKDLLRDRESHDFIKVQVGVLDTIPKNLSQKLLENVLSKEKAFISVVEGRLDKLLKELNSYQIDLVLSNRQPPSDIGFKVLTKLVGEVPVDVVGAPKFSFLRDRFPESLNNVEMIMPMPESTLRQEFDAYLELKHVHPHVRAEIEDIELQKRLVVSGLGVTVLPTVAIEKELASGELVRLNTTPIMHEKLWLIASHRLVHNSIAKEILATFRLPGVSQYE